MPEPPKITTSLAERIAKLNANVSHEKAGSGSSSSTPPGEIKSKISRYEASGQHEAPLVPKGSFGLGAPLAAPSRGLDRIRIASSGVSGGQTLVPPRSAGPTDRRSFSGQQQSQHSQRSSVHSDLSDSPPSGTRARHSLGPNFPTLANDPPQSSHKPIHLAPVGPPTPGAMSTISAQAQPGSEPSSPLASPLATPLASLNNPLDSTVNVDTDPEDARVEETRQALERFEAEENDPVARPSSGLLSSLVSSTMSMMGPTTASEDDGAPIEPPPMKDNVEPTNVTDQEENGSTTDSHEAYDGILDAYPSSSSVSGSIHDQEGEPELPTVKCADCGRPLSLLELSEHICSPTKEIEDDMPQQLSPVRPVPADVPIDAHEIENEGDVLDGPVTVDPTSENELDDLPEEIEVSEAEEEPVVEHKPTPIITPAPEPERPVEFSPAQPSPQSLDRPSPRSLEHPSLRNVSSSSPKSINLPSPRSLGPGSARHSWYDDEDEGPHEVTGYATIVRRSRG